MTKTINAPAKINLYLDVLSKRIDGYHNIKSIMQSVSLFDTVAVSENDRITVSCTNPEVPTDERNIAYKAAKLFFESSGIRSGAKIDIDKKIPMAGGLAGGSTDGAAVLTALNSLYCNVFSDIELINLAAKLGADVPFCLKQGCALCLGVGELMTDISSKLHFDIVIAKGPESVSTPEAYKLLDEEYGERLSDDFGNVESVINALTSDNKNLLFSSAYNIFEKVILPSHSYAAILKKMMNENGAEFAMMSGSGPSVFGIFPDPVTSQNAENVLRAAGFDAFRCESL